MKPTFCMIYPNRLNPPPSAFSIEDDDARLSSTAVISDDQLNAAPPTFAPTLRPGARVKTVRKSISLGLVYAPIIDYNAFYNCYMGSCPELQKLNASMKVSLSLP